MTQATATKVPARSKVQGWVVYNYDSNEVAYFSMSRQDARDFRRNNSDMNLSGPRRANANLQISN